MLKSQKTVGAKNLLPVHTAKNNVGAKSAKAEYVSNTPVQNEKTYAPVGAKNVSPLQSVQSKKNPKKLAHLKKRRIFASSNIVADNSKSENNINNIAVSSTGNGSELLHSSVTVFDSTAFLHFFVMSNTEKNQKKIIRKRYLASLREAYAQELFSKFLNDYPGTLTMKFSKGAWGLSFSWGHEKVQAQGKTLAHALINLAAKSPLTLEGGMQPSEQNSTESKSSLSFGEGWGEEFKSVAL